MTVPRRHRSHDYKHLIARWRAVAKVSGVPLRKLSKVSGYQAYYMRTKALPPEGGIYISAGIHGDEPAAVEALVTWAEKHARLLSHVPCMLFPCLNPWGLVNNRRSSEEGGDMNRLFHRDDIPLINAVKALAGVHKFEVALMLHEDYDGQGLYLYETERTKPYWGEDLIKATRHILPVDRRQSIDKRKPLKPGIVRRKVNLKVFQEIGFPEAIHLHFNNCERTFTIETPSEFSLELRVAAHVAIIQECVKRVMKKKR